MEKAPPTYKLAYSKCQRGSLHDGESLNFVCLNQGCASKSLICPICKSEEHVDHEVRPFKFYVEDLWKRFSGEQNNDLNDQLNQLDRRRDEYLLAIEDVVKDLSEQFRKLETIVIGRFETMKSELLEEECLRNQFDNFYQAISREGHPEVHMLVQQFLPKKPQPEIPKPDRIRDLMVVLHKSLQDTVKYYEVQTSDNKPEQQLESRTNPFNIQHSPSLVVLNNMLVPKTDEYTLVLFGNKITPENHKLKLRLKSAAPKLTLGVITLNDFNEMKFVWNPSNTNNKIYWINSEGKHMNANYNCMTVLNQNDSIDLSLKKGQFVINNKKAKSYSTFLVKAIPGQDWYFFLALDKQTQVEIASQKK